MKYSTLLLASVLLIPVSVDAQSSLLPDDPGYAGVEFLKPSFNDRAMVSSYTLYFSARQKVAANTRIEIGLPFTHLGYDGGGSENAFGNLYLGVETRLIEESSGLDFGIWVPTASEEKLDALLVGAVTDLNRWESFFPKIFSAQLGGSYWFRSPTGSGFRLRGAPSIMIPTEGGGDPELFIMYSAHFGYFGEQAEIAGGFLGRLLLTEEDLDLDERSTHQMEVQAVLKAEAARIGLVLLVPIDDENDYLDFVFGFQLGAAFE